jgi:hypothetical protein
MNFLISIIIFVIVFFFYIHLVNQFKKSEDLEIYEMDYINNNQLQEICELKQPILFDLKEFNPEIIELINDKTIETKKITHELKVKDINDYWNETDTNNSIEHVVLPFHGSTKLISTDMKSQYFTENNNEFIEESEYHNDFKNMDTYFKPSFTVHTKYDICMGSKKVVMPLRYHTNYRQFYIVNCGKMHIKMTPWKSTKYLHPILDYENYEFRSPINVWNPQPKYATEMDKLKFLEFDVPSGYIIYIPPYWWYSIKYSNEDNTLLCGFTYCSLMNTVANTPTICKHILQQFTTKKKIVKTLNVRESSSSSSSSTSETDNKNTDDSKEVQIVEEKESDKSNL